MGKNLIIFLMFAGVTFGANAQHSDICIVDAKRLIYAGKYDQAEQLIRSCMPDDHNNEVVVELISLSKFKGGELADAYKYASLVPDSLSSESLLLLKGKILFASGKYRMSADCFSLLVDLDSCNSFYHSQLASSYYRAGDILDVKGPALKALELKFPNAITTQLAANILYLQGEWLSADSILSNALLFDSIPVLFKLKADVNYKLKEYEIAWENYRYAIDEGNSDQVLIRKAGISRYLMGVSDESIEILSLAYDMDPTDEICCYYLASAYQSNGEYDKAELFFNAAVNNGYSNNLALYYHRLGVNFEQQGNYKSALKAFKLALEYRDEDKAGTENILFEIGRIYEVYLKDTANAIHSYRSFIEVSTDTSASNYRVAKRKLEQLSPDSSFMELDK